MGSQKRITSPGTLKSFLYLHLPGIQDVFGIRLASYSTKLTFVPCSSKKNNSIDYRLFRHSLELTPRACVNLTRQMTSKSLRGATQTQMIIIIYESLFSTDVKNPCTVYAGGFHSAGRYDTC